MSFAKITVMGNLGNDPETRYTPNGAMVVSFSMAVNPRRRNQQGGEEAPPVWYRVSAWDRLGERIDKLAQQGYVNRGSRLLVTGAFEPREFQGNDGSKRISYDITLESFEFVGGNRDQEGSGGYGGQQSGGYGGNRGGGYGDSQGGNRGGGGNDYRDASGGSNRRQAFADDDANGNGNSMDDVPF